MRPLSGVKVVDGTRLLPGGFCTMLLSDLGAEVVKVEQPGVGDYMRLTPPMGDGPSLVHGMVSRDKLSIGIDLKKQDGKKVMARLLKKADVFVEGFRPGAIDRLGFSFENAKALNPRIIYCSISAFGANSPLSLTPGHDINFQAMSGALSYSNDPEIPMVQLGDMCSGMYAALGVLAALARAKKGAVHIDVPIVQSLVSWMLIPVSAYLVTKRNPGRGHSLIFGSEAWYRTYRTSDGRHLAVAAIEDQFWHNLLESLGRPDLEGMRDGTAEQRARLVTELEDLFAAKTRDEWVGILMNRDTCVTPVLTIQEAIGSDWAKKSGLLTRAGDEMVLDLPISFFPSVRARKRRAPRLGEHTNAIMRGLGYSPAQVRALKNSGAVQ